MALLLLCMAFWSLQTWSNAKVPSPLLPTSVLMTAIVELDKPPLKLEMLSARWEHDGRALVEYKDQKLTVHNDRARIPLEQVKDGNVSLILVNITLSDSGNYTCLVQYGNQQEKIQYLLIIETHRLRLLNLSSKKAAQDSKGPNSQTAFLQMGGYPQVNAKPGQHVTLTCKFNTDPTMELPMLTIRWSKDGKTKWFYNVSCCNSQEVHISEEELYKGNANLNLGQVQEEDSGLYICNIKYRTMEKSVKTVVTVTDDDDPSPRSVQGVHQSDDPDSTNTTSDKYRAVKIALVCGVVAGTYFFVFIIFFFIP